jgi:hypothetical protein
VLYALLQSQVLAAELFNVPDRSYRQFRDHFIYLLWGILCRKGLLESDTIFWLGITEHFLSVFFHDSIFLALLFQYWIVPANLLSRLNKWWRINRFHVIWRCQDWDYTWRANWRDYIVRTLFSRIMKLVEVKTGLLVGLSAFIWLHNKITRLIMNQKSEPLIISNHLT